MRNELTNLLPLERSRALRRDYFMRLGVVSLLFVIMLMLAAAILLLPTYVFLTASESSGKTRLASIDAAASSSDDAALSAQLAALFANTVSLSALAEKHSISTIMRAVLEVSRPGVTLSNFAYTSASATNKNQNTLTISGSAATRDALRNYQLALQGSSFAQSADLPVSAYAQDTNIAFTIAVTLAP